MLTLLENVARGFALLLLSIVLYIAITLFILGSTFVLREALRFYFGIDIANYMPKIEFENKKPKKKKVVLNEASDDEWLKTRGRW